MIQRDFYKKREDGVGLYRSYSDAGLYMCKVGTEEVYAEAIDVEDCEFAYEETDLPIEAEETEETKVANDAGA